jgi:hypothetical protein
MAVFKDTAPCSVDTDRRFRGAYCCHHQGDWNSSETSVSIYHTYNIPEDSRMELWSRSLLKDGQFEDRKNIGKIIKMNLREIGCVDERITEGTRVPALCQALVLWCWTVELYDHRVSSDCSRFIESDRYLGSSCDVIGRSMFRCWLFCIRHVGPHSVRIRFKQRLITETSSINGRTYSSAYPNCLCNFQRNIITELRTSFWSLLCQGVINTSSKFILFRSQWPCGLRRGLDRLVPAIVGSNPAQGMDVCPPSFCVVLSCVGRGLATGWSLVQGFLPYVQIVQETSYMWGDQGPKGL